MKSIWLTIALLTTVSSSDTRQPIVDLKSAIEGLWIQPSQFNTAGKPRFIRFVVIAYDYSDSGTLKIIFELPKNHSPQEPGYILKRDGIEYVAENFLYREGDNYHLNLPNLQKDERIEFSIGWVGASPAEYKISAVLKTDKRSKTAEWVGWLLR